MPSAVIGSKLQSKQKLFLMKNDEYWLTSVQQDGQSLTLCCTLSRLIGQHKPERSALSWTRWQLLCWVLQQEDY